MTLGEHVVEMAERDIIDAAVRPDTKRILRRCMGMLRQTVEDLAEPEAGRMALRACFGRHVILICPTRGLVVDMLQWAKPLDELQTEDLNTRAQMWALLAQSIHQGDADKAMLIMASRLGPAYIAQYDETLAKLDKTRGEVVFEADDMTTRLVTRGVIIAMAGINQGRSTGVIGVLPVPVMIKPGPVADWNIEDGPVADGARHRLLN